MLIDGWNTGYWMRNDDDDDWTIIWWKMTIYSFLSLPLSIPHQKHLLLDVLSLQLGPQPLLHPQVAVVIHQLIPLLFYQLLQLHKSLTLQPRSSIILLSPFIHLFQQHLCQITYYLLLFLSTLNLLINLSTLLFYVAQFFA